jgi:hypothetical protein
VTGDDLMVEHGKTTPAFGPLSIAASTVTTDVISMSRLDVGTCHRFLACSG